MRGIHCLLSLTLPPSDAMCFKSSNDLGTRPHCRDNRSLLRSSRQGLRRRDGRTRVQAIRGRPRLELHARNGLSPLSIVSPSHPISGISLISGLLQDGPFRTTISEPTGKMCAYFPIVNEHITKRNKKVSNCRFSPCREPVKGTADTYNPAPGL